MSASDYVQPVGPLSSNVGLLSNLTSGGFMTEGGPASDADHSTSKAWSSVRSVVRPIAAIDPLPSSDCRPRMTQRSGFGGRACTMSSQSRAHPGPEFGGLKSVQVPRHY